MEVEVDAKALFGWLLVALIVLGLVFAASHGGASLVEKKVSILLHGGKASSQAATSTKKGESPESPAVAQTTPKATTDKTDEETTGEVVSFEDLSSKWDWTVSPDCASRILDFLSQDNWVRGHKIEKLVIGLVDEKAPEKLRPGPKGQEYELLYGAGLPEHAQGGNYHYGAVAGCYMAKDDQAEETGTEKCYVAPKIWKTDYDQLSVTVVAAFVSAIEENLRPRTLDAWKEYSDRWSIANYVPLIRKEGSKWHTECLQVKPQR